MVNVHRPTPILKPLKFIWSSSGVENEFNNNNKQTKPTNVLF
jgi:hypothetical protein